MKNETKTGLTSGAKLTIPGCDYWGEYDGYKVFKCYSKTIPAGYPQIVFAIGNKLFMNGGCVGRVDDGGRVSNWAPKKWVKEEPKTKSTGRPVEFDTTTFKTDTASKASSISAEEILNGSWKRSVEDLVGEKFSVEYKYSE